MTTAVYPGSFDPITLGHLDIIKRTAAVFDKVIIGVLINKAKKPLFSIEERVELIKEVTKNIPNVEIVSFNGLLIEFSDKMKADVIVRTATSVSTIFFIFKSFLSFSTALRRLVILLLSFVTCRLAAAFSFY